MLVIVLLLSAVITLTVLAFSLGVGTDLRISRNDLLGRQALAAAEAGVQRGMAALQQLANTTQASGRVEAMPSFLDPVITSIQLDGLVKVSSEDPAKEMCKFLPSCKTKKFPEIGENGGSYEYYYSCVDYKEGEEYCLRLIDNHDEIGEGFRCSKTTDDQNADCDFSVTLRSRGEVGGAVRIVDALLSLSPVPDCAIVANGDLALSGSLKVTGANGCAHGNGNVLISGAMSASDQVTSSGSMSVQNSGVSVGGVDLNTSALRDGYELNSSDQSIFPMPRVRPMQFGFEKTPLHEQIMNHSEGFRLDADGGIYVGPGWSCDENGSGCIGGSKLSPADIVSRGLSDWKYLGGSWVAQGSVRPGMYFSETAVEIKGTSSPWRAAIVSLNSIRYTGSPIVSAYYQTTNPLAVDSYLDPFKPPLPSDPESYKRAWSLRNILLVSGNDIELMGTGTGAQYTGGLYAHQQINASGNFFLKGFVYAENGASSWDGDLYKLCDSSWNLQGCSGSTFSGNFTIEYNGIGSAAVGPRVHMLSWSDVK